MNKSPHDSPEIDSRYCLPLNSPDTSLSQVGGKAKNLAKLVHRAFRVPDGFIVTVAAYSDFVDRAGLADRILEEIASVDPHDPDALAAHSERLRARISESPIPPAWAPLSALLTPRWEVHRRPSAPRLLPKICPTCPLPASTTHF